MEHDTAANDGQANSAKLNVSLPVGLSLMLESISPARKMPVRLLGFVEGKSILVSAPLREGKEIYLEKGSAVIVRFMDGRKACAFESHVVYRAVQPFSYYHLAFPHEIESTLIRNAERIDTQLDAWVDSDFIVVDDWPKPASITNLSCSGARIEAPELLGQAGHELIVDFRLEVSGITKRVHVAGVIRNCETLHRDAQSSQYAMGLEFRDLNDETRLSLANYIHEHP